MKTIINWRVFFILWIASTIAIIAILPYTLELQSGALEQLDYLFHFPLLLLYRSFKMDCFSQSVYF